MTRGRLPSRSFLRRAAVRTAIAAASLVALPLRRLGGLVPRDANLAVVSGPSGRFTGNPRHFFLAQADSTDITYVWIARDRVGRDEIRALGHRSELRWSAAGLWTCLRAGWYVFGAYLGDINYWTARGATSFNLWHGIGIKGIEYAITTGPLAKLYHSPRWSPIRLAFLDRFEAPDYFLSTSPFVTERCFADAFRISPDVCIEIGYPRTDHFFEADATEQARQSIDIPDGDGEVIGYFPTWRDDGNDFLEAAGFSFDALNDVLAATARRMIVKAHPNFADVIPTTQHWSNIRVLDASIDLNAIMPACDVVVTDYSSVAYDFMLLDRPVVFFVPDYDRFVQARNLNFDFEEMSVGAIVKSTDALFDLLGADELPALDRERHDRVRTLFWGDYQGRASQRIHEFFVERSAPHGDGPPIRPSNV